jgi:predicted RNA-binding Zn ribbon-like protein
VSGVPLLDREPDSALPLARQFRFDAGSPALNLLATRGFRGSPDPVERLTSGTRLRDWLTANDLPRVGVDDAGLDAARRLREAAYAVLAALVDGSGPAGADVAVLGDWAGRARPGRGRRPAGDRVEWAEATETIETVLADLAQQLAGLAVDGAAGLRQCAADPCHMLYLDRSRGQRRRWCSMNRCGNSAKAARHRARTAGDAR